MHVVVGFEVGGGGVVGYCEAGCGSCPDVDVGSAAALGGSEAACGFDVAVVVGDGALEAGVGFDGVFDLERARLEWESGPVG